MQRGWRLGNRKQEQEGGMKENGSTTQFDQKVPSKVQNIREGGQRKWGELGHQNNAYGSSLPKKTTRGEEEMNAH